MQHLENFKNDYFNVKNEFNPFIRNVLDIVSKNLVINTRYFFYLKSKSTSSSHYTSINQFSFISCF